MTVAKAAASAKMVNDDQEGAPSQGALAGGAGHHPGHGGPHEGLGICGEVPCPQG